MPKEDKEDDIVVVEETEEGQAGGDIDSTREEEREKSEKKVVRKRGNDNQKRINELWMARKAAEEAANLNAAQIVSERAKNSEYEKITAAALEENLSTKRELLTERLVRAQEAGDNKKSAEITAELSKIEAQAAQIERYKIENQVRTSGAHPQNNGVQRQQSSDDIYESLSPAGKRWMDENRDWYDASGDAHDPEKSADVTYYAQTLEGEYRDSGRGAEIGTRAYFKKIDDYIKNNWSDDDRASANEEEEDERPAPKRSYAAPVGNRSAGTQSGAGQRKEYKITAAEKEMALSLEIKDRTGKPLSDGDKIKRFIAIREGTPSSGPISMATIKSKGA